MTTPRMPEEISSTRTTLLVGAVLLLLTGTTIAVAHVNLHGWNPLVGLGIAATKALLIGARDRSYADQLFAERTAQMARIRALAAGQI
jgi:hypothetical protein